MVLGDDTVDYLTTTATVTLQVNGGTPAPVYSYSITDYAANGNVTGYTDSVNGTWSFDGGYDGLDRLTGATATAGYYAGLALGWSYDTFGNRTGETVGGTASVNVPPSQDATYNANNQVATSSLMSGGAPLYDASGDMTQDSLNQYLYDGDGRVCAVKDDTTGAMVEYIYDAEGNRVAKGTIQAWTCDTTQNTFVASNSYVIGPSGEQLSETDGNGNPVHTNVFAAGSLIATYDPAGLHFQLGDWVGTRRVQTSYAGSIEETCASLPFGGGQDCAFASGADDATEHHFAGYQRDAESGNDYAQARYYASMTGRFLSPDPSTLAYADPTNPQSFNLYGYAYNNPLSFIDPTGLQPFCSDYTVVQGSGTSQPTDPASCTAAGGIWGTTDTTISVDGNGGAGNCTGLCLGDDPLSALYGIEQQQYYLALEQQGGYVTPEALAQGVVQGVARDTAGFPDVCSVGAYGQVGYGDVAVGGSYDSNSGGNVYGANNMGSAGGGEDPDNDPAPFSLTLKGNTKGARLTATVRDPVTGVGGAVSVNNKGTPTVSVSVRKGVVTVGATATLGTIGNPQCQHR